MISKIELPSALREQIETSLANLQSELNDSVALREKLTGDLAKLKAEAFTLTEQIQKLRSEALANSDAINAFSIAETRQRLVTERSNDLREQLENLRPVSLIGVKGILAELAIFYSEALPPMIADTLAPFCSNRSQALQIAKFTDAARQVRSVNGLANIYSRQTLATPESMAQLTGIFKRALCGQPTLCADAPSPGAAES